MYTDEQKVISSLQETSVNINDKNDEVNKLNRELVAEKEYTKYLEDELRLSKREIDLLKQFHARKLESMNSSAKVENFILNLTR